MEMRYSMQLTVQVMYFYDDHVFCFAELNLNLALVMQKEKVKMTGSLNLFPVNCTENFENSLPRIRGGFPDRNDLKSGLGLS